MAVKCCERDLDGDGNCDRHPALVPSSQPETPTPWEHTRCYNCGSPAVDHPNSGYCANRDGGFRCEKFVALPVVQDEALKAKMPALSLVDQSTLDRIDASLAGVNGLAPHISIDDEWRLWKRSGGTWEVPAMASFIERLWHALEAATAVVPSPSAPEPK